MLLSIVKLEAGDPLPWPLLLLADEFVGAIEQYIYQCAVYVINGRGGCTIGVFALYRNNPGELEIKNIAVVESLQGMGLGGYMLKAIEDIALAGYRRIVVGTAMVGRQLGFYRKNGFREFGLRKDFFLLHYPQPIYEDGELLVDMVLLEKTI